MHKKFKGDTVPGIITILFGVFFFIMTIIAPNVSFGSTTSDGVPGAGFFPYLLSGIIIIFGTMLTVRGLKKNGELQFLKLDEEIKKNLRVLLLTLIGLIVFLTFWHITNLFYVGVLLFCVYLNKVFGRDWKFTIIYTVVFTLFIYLVFAKAFSIQFKI